jgi:hypothetical protein
MTDQCDDFEREFSSAVDAEVARLKSEGYSKAYICERSHDIEDSIRAELEAKRAESGGSRPPKP